MAQNFWTAIFSWSTCFVITIAVSLATRKPEESRLAGLVYSLTPKISEAGVRWYLRPPVMGLAVIAVTVVLNIIFR